MTTGSLRNIPLLELKVMQIVCRDLMVLEDSSHVMHQHDRIVAELDRRNNTWSDDDEVSPPAVHFQRSSSR
mgnify:CR=1 FL=1